MARIFGVDIKNEPYLVHVLKRALRHYGNCVKEKRKVKERLISPSKSSSKSSYDLELDCRGVSEVLFRMSKTSGT